MGKMRKGVRCGRILLLSTATLSEHDPIIRTPSILTTKKLPDRTLSSEKRLISMCAWPMLGVTSTIAQRRTRPDLMKAPPGCGNSREVARAPL